ncbi:MAG: nitrate reductase molybdenum cofactor assembly chaperone [Pseudorhodoplanes sp.]|nr:MAG: nitrate reductase molybdenum cofactor assembly chaperone [Pseudorhodoplanes sp.]
MAKTFKALSALLSYPTPEFQRATGETSEVIEREALLPPRVRDQLQALLLEIATGDIYDLQERYILLFDRTRSLSLHLFEHVHGESRDRGQAMIDLKALYEQHGLAIGTSELPDFVPLFLEFLSTLPFREAQEHLAQTVHILSALAERLRKRQSPYEAAFRALTALAAVKARPEDVANLLQEDDPDPDNLEALDAAWLDEEVRFGPGADNCKDGLVARLRAARRPAGAPRD